MTTPRADKRQSQTTGGALAAWRIPQPMTSPPERKKKTTADALVAVAEDFGVSWPKTTQAAIAETIDAADAEHKAKRIASLIRGEALDEWRSAKAQHLSEQAKGDPENFKLHTVAAPSPDTAVEMHKAYRERLRAADAVLASTLGGGGYRANHKAISKVWDEYVAAEVPGTTSIADAAALDARNATARNALRNAALTLANTAGMSAKERKIIKHLQDERGPDYLPDVLDARKKVSGAAEAAGMAKHAAKREAEERERVSDAARVGAGARTRHEPTETETETTPAKGEEGK